MSPSRHRANIVAALLLSSALLSGCGVGLEAQTYKETGRGDSTSVDLEGVSVRNLHIEEPLQGTTIAAGDAAVLLGTFVSKDGAADTLTSVTTDAAESVVLATVEQNQAVQASSIAVPAGGVANEWGAVLQGLTAPLRSATYVEVTLTFANAGQTTVRVPVHLGDGELDTREVIQHPYGEGEGG